MRAMLLLEINEVPWRVIDRYLGRPGYENLTAFFRDSDQHTTITVDSGELSPWVTWPTVHRGMSNQEHGIANLGQDPQTFRGEPIWESIRALGHSIGVFGSMQSWPPKDPGLGGFYVPDTFAHDESCIPPSVAPIQLVPTLMAMWKHGIGLQFALKVAAQLAMERIDRSRVNRRPVFQTILFWQVFKSLFNQAQPPTLTTFFTNHVAGVMHRYWADVFPEDFAEENFCARPFAVELMDFAMKVTDDIIGDGMRWARNNKELCVVFASSMGQAAVKHPEHEGIALLVDDLAALMHAAGAAKGTFQPLMAMVPQVAVEIEDASLRASVRSSLQEAALPGGARFIHVSEKGKSLSITVSTPRKSDLHDGVVSIAGKRLSLANCGMRIQEVDAGTGYHVPEGVLAIYDLRRKGRPGQDRAKIPADRVKSALIRYMSGGSWPDTDVESVAFEGKAS